MKIPKNLSEFSEEQLVDIILKTIQPIANSFQFGYYTEEDLVQEGFIYAMKALPRFKTKKSSQKSKIKALKTFIITHVRNQFINLLRAKLKRVEPPCMCCKHYEYDNCIKYENRENCKKWQNWKKINQNKYDLMQTFDSSDVRAEEAISEFPDISQKIILKELRHYIEENLPSEYLADYHRWLNNVSIVKPKRLKLERLIKELGTIYIQDEEI